MNILLVANGYPPTAYGGVEIYTADVSRTLQACGHRVTVLCAEGNHTHPDGCILEERVAGIPVFRLVNTFKHIRTFEETFADAQIETRFAEVVDKIAPDVIYYNHLITLSARLPYVSHTLQIPAIIMLHDFWALCQRINLRDWQQRPCPGPVCGGDCYRCMMTRTWAQRMQTVAIATLRRLVPYPLRVVLRRLLARGDHFLPDIQVIPEVLARRYELFREAILTGQRILTPSHFVKTMFVKNGYPPDRFEVLSLGMTLPSPPSPSPSAPQLRVGFVGALSPLKGVDTLIRAFRRVNHPAMRLYLHGRADIVPAYGRTLRRLARGDPRIVFAGPFQPTEKDAIYRQLDVVVIPSVAYESFSLVAREALLRGKPVIAAAIGALPEVVHDQINGFLFPPGDDRALAHLLTRLATHPVQLAELQTPGPVSIESVDTHVAYIERVMEDVVNGAGLVVS